jgi:hypothetical protein
MQLEALQAEVREGLMGWTFTGVSPMGQQQLRDLEAEAVDHLGLLFVSAHGLTEQENDAGKHGVSIFGRGLDICSWKRH